MVKLLQRECPTALDKDDRTAVKDDGPMAIKDGPTVIETGWSSCCAGGWVGGDD